jgi:hypothetical protein
MKENMMKPERVEFSNVIPLLGVLGGLALALGTCYIMLVHGRHLPAGVQTAVIVMALLLGGCAVLLSAFFGGVMPKSVWRDMAPRELQREEGKEEDEK